VEIALTADVAVAQGLMVGRLVEKSANALAILGRLAWLCWPRASAPARAQVPDAGLAAFQDG